jgi:LuxR family maltose regulon positive regulatory protein
LIRKLGAEEIAKMHAAAGRWYAQNGWIEEALNHLLAAGDTSAAIEVVSQHRYRMMNANRWPRLERWLNLFPSMVVESSSELWMLKTWLAYHRGLWSELPALLGQLSSIISKRSEQEGTKSLTGEINSLHSLIAYHRGASEEAISQACIALENLPAELWIVRILARSYLGTSLLAIGDQNRGYDAFYGAFREEKIQNNQFKSTLLMAACYYHWISADLQSTAQAARQSIAICPETGYQSILGYGKYNLGRVHYQQNDLITAERLFSSVIAKPYQNYGDCYTNSACGLAMTYQAQGMEAEARQVTERTIAFLLETGNTTQLPIALALQAELELMQGNLPTIGPWAEKLDQFPPIVPLIGFLAPHLTLAKISIAQNSSASVGKAAKLLNQLEVYLTGINHTRFLIETLALQAMLVDATGDQAAALDSLVKALQLAQPGGFIRLFVDLGPKMAVLFSRMSMDHGIHAYVNQIRSAFPENHLIIASINQADNMEALSSRELQVLELLGRRLTNKEIAAQLVIAPGTVKAHTIRIYQKLAVNSRQQAVQKAIALGILSLD